MTSYSPASPSSLTERVTPIDAGTEIAAAAFLGRVPAFALADGHVLLAEIGEERRIKAHEDGGDSRRRQRRRPALHRRRRRRRRRDRRRRSRPKFSPAKKAGSMRSPAAPTGRWPGRAARPSAPGTPRARSKPGPRPPRRAGWPFSPRAIASPSPHYNGASLWFPNTAAAPEVLELERLASRRDSFAGRAFRRHLDAGKFAARLAPRRSQEHAHDRLSGQDALPRLVA